jgi:hypothetical protein
MTHWLHCSNLSHRERVVVAPTDSIAPTFLRGKKVWNGKGYFGRSLWPPDVQFHTLSLVGQCAHPALGFDYKLLTRQRKESSHCDRL